MLAVAFALFGLLALLAAVWLIGSSAAIVAGVDGANVRSGPGTNY